MNFTEVLAKWKANPRFADRKEKKECCFNDQKYSPFWVFSISRSSWESSFATPFMYNHKDYSIMLIGGQTYDSDTEIAAAIALPGKALVEFDDISELWRFIDSEKDAMKDFKSDKDIIFITEDSDRPAPGSINNTDKLVCYVNPHFGKLRIYLTQYSPYRTLLEIQCELTSKLDLRKLISPFISDEVFIIELIEKATKHFQKYKTTLSAEIKEGGKVCPDIK